MSEENLNIDDYNIQELMEILDLEELNPTLIDQKTDTYIQKFNEENNPDMANFFKEVREKLNDSYKEQTVENWFKNEYPLKQNQEIQNSKITSRKNLTQEFDGALKQERLAINQSKPLPFAQGELNPTLRNSIQKILNIDSTYRTNNVPAHKSVPYTSTGVWSSTHFTSDLSDPLTRTLSLQLYSVQIPYTWYNIPLGSNCFQYKDVVYAVPPGNYTIENLKTTIDSLSGPELTLDISKFETTAKVSFVSTSITLENLIFFTTSGFTSVECGGCNYPNQINNTLGWILGFREPCYEISTSNPVNAEAIADLNGPKYLLLYLDEFNQNRVNKGIVSIEDTETKLDLPSYYKTANISTQNNAFENVPPDCGNDIEVIGNDCIVQPYPVKVPFYTQDLPRTLTQAQQYTVNEIIKNRKNSPNLKILPPSPNNIMAVIPVKPNGLRFGGLLVENANSLTFNKRNYFGPVDIERVEVKLLDDKGNQLDLNGAEWSFSIITTQLYQY
jgi:hypothetical protein